MFFHQWNNVAGGGCVSPNKQNLFVWCVCLQASCWLHYLVYFIGVAPRNYFLEEPQNRLRCRTSLQKRLDSGHGWPKTLDVFNTWLHVPHSICIPAPCLLNAFALVVSSFSNIIFDWVFTLTMDLIQKELFFQSKSIHSSCV